MKVRDAGAVGTCSSISGKRLWSGMGVCVWEGVGVSLADCNQTASGVGGHPCSVLPGWKEAGRPEKWAGQGTWWKGLPRCHHKALHAGTFLGIRTYTQKKGQGDHSHQEQATWVGPSPHPHLMAGTRHLLDPKGHRNNRYLLQGLHRTRLITQLKSPNPEASHVGGFTARGPSPTQVQLFREPHFPLPTHRTA